MVEARRIKDVGRLEAVLTRIAGARAMTIVSETLPQSRERGRGAHILGLPERTPQTISRKGSLRSVAPAWTLDCMQAPLESSMTASGARFFDGRRRDLGRATRVSERKPLLGTLTILDVTTSEPALAASLLMLDKGRLLVKGEDSAGGGWDFMWASGYANGSNIRIQGVLVHTFGAKSV
jgi:hypothetical protein